MTFVCDGKTFVLSFWPEAMQRIAPLTTTSVSPKSAIDAVMHSEENFADEIFLIYF